MAVHNYDTYSRNLEIHKKYMNGSTYEELAKEYGVSKGRIADIVHKVDSYEDDARYNNSLYESFIKAAQKLDKMNLATKVYNILYRGGLVPHILEGNINLMDYSDEDFKAFRNLGASSIELIRAAWYIYKGTELPDQMAFPAIKTRDYLTGEDLVRLIRKHKLSDKIISTSPLHPEDNNLEFDIKLPELDSEDPKDRIYEVHSINLKTGEFKIVKDYVN